MVAAATAEAIQAWLAEVPDPELPQLSVVELGIVRAVKLDPAGAVVVTITPTYAGCPAMLAIAEAIVDAVRNHGIEKVRVETCLTPPWTTDWIGPEAREKLRASGIAPPGAAQWIGVEELLAPRREQPTCPNCGAPETAEISRFGATPCKALHRCTACGEPFEHFKSHGAHSHQYPHASPPRSRTR